MNQATDLLRQAQQLAQTCPTWADFSNSLYDPLEGILARAFPTQEERRQFLQTAEFREIQQLMSESIERHGLLEGATPKRITEYMVQLHLTASAQDSQRPLFRFENAGSTEAAIPSPEAAR